MILKDTFKTVKHIGIYGTGLAAMQSFKAFNKMQITVDFFLDGDDKKIGKTFCGKEIVDLNRISKNIPILIAANPRYGIHERLKHAGVEQWEYIDPEWIRLYSNGFDSEAIKDILRTNEKKIRRVYDMLQDEFSKKVFHAVLQHRTEHNLSLIDSIYDENQYFGNDLIPSISGTFVDCGAFTGDTLKRFIKQIGGGYSYHAFEADKQNCTAILAYCKENSVSNVNVYNLAVYDEKKTFMFLQDDNDKKVSGKILDTNNADAVDVRGDLIDNVLGDINVDMITMDIEGAEIHALYGARKCITTWHPKLAISAYHTIEHLWEIPLLIKEMNPEYQIYYKHHQWNMHDTVCYAIMR